SWSAPAAPWSAPAGWSHPGSTDGCRDHRGVRRLRRVPADLPHTCDPSGRRPPLRPRRPVHRMRRVRRDLPRRRGGPDRGGSLSEAASHGTWTRAERVRLSGIVATVVALSIAGWSLYTADSLIMTRAYSWAYRHPARRLYCNLATTGMTVLVAFFVA